MLLGEAQLHVIPTHLSVNIRAYWFFKYGLATSPEEENFEFEPVLSYFKIYLVPHPASAWIYIYIYIYNHLYSIPEPSLSSPYFPLTKLSP